MVLAVRDPVAALEKLNELGETAYVIGQVESHEGDASLRFDLPGGFFHA